MKLLLGIEGGIGKNIAATGAAAIASKDRTVDIITAHPSIWQGNPNINKVYDWNRIEYMNEFVKKYDDIIFGDPYRHTTFLLGDSNLTATYNYMLNEIYEPVQPQVWLNMAEKLYVESILEKIEKPIMVVQTNGGLNEGYAWNRDLPLDEAVEVLNQFQDEYEIIHLRMNGQLEIGGIKHTADLNIRQCIQVLQMSSKRLLIDSVYQHACAALNLPATVLWVLTESEKFGYDLHDNIECNQPILKNMDRLEGLFTGLDSDVGKCPFGQNQKIFDTEKIVASLKQK